LTKLSLMRHGLSHKSFSTSIGSTMWLMTLFRKVNQSKWTHLLVIPTIKKDSWKLHACVFWVFHFGYLKNKKIIAELDDILTFSWMICETAWKLKCSVFVFCMSKCCVWCLSTSLFFGAKHVQDLLLINLLAIFAVVVILYSFHLPSKLQ